MFAFELVYPTVAHDIVGMKELRRLYGFTFLVCLQHIHWANQCDAPAPLKLTLLPHPSFGSVITSVRLPRQVAGRSALQVWSFFRHDQHPSPPHADLIQTGEIQYQYRRLGAIYAICGVLSLVIVPHAAHANAHVDVLVFEHSLLPSLCVTR